MNKTNVLLLYGLPCSGKSSVLQAMSNYHAIAVDTIITKIVADPSIADFVRFSPEIVKNIVSEINNQQSKNYIIEMGCLISKQAIDQLESSLSDQGYTFFNINLIADDDELEQRIINRNRDIDSGKRQGIKVDGPDYLTRFKQVFDKNLPDRLIAIDTTAKSQESVLLEIIKNTFDSSIHIIG